MLYPPPASHAPINPPRAHPCARPHRRTTPAPFLCWRLRIQFYVFEIARNRLGLNDKAHEIAKEEAAKEKEKAEKEKARAEREKARKKKN